MENQKPPIFSADREPARGPVYSAPEAEPIFQVPVSVTRQTILQRISSYISDTLGAHKGWFILLGSLVTIALIGAVYVFVTQNDSSKSTASSLQPSSKFSVQDVALRGVLRPDTLDLSTIQALSVNGQLRANNSLVLAPTTQPNTSSATVGQVYFDKTGNALAYYNGTQFISVAGTNDIAALRADLAAVNTRVSAIPAAQTISTAPTIPSDIATLSANNTFTGTNSFSAALSASSLTAGALTTTGNTSLQGSLTVTGTTTFGPTTASSLVLSSPLDVSSGGTGASSFTANGVLIGQGTSPVATVAAGAGNLCLMSNAGNTALEFDTCPGGSGSGVTSLNGIDGTLTLSNATGVGTTLTIDDAGTTSKGIASFNATNFSVTAGAVNTIQNIGTGASPTFVGITANTLTSTLNQNLTLNAAGTGNLYLTGYDCSASGGGGKLTVDATGQVICGADGDTDTTGITTITAGNGITITGGNNTIAASVRTGFGIQVDGNGIGLIDTCLTNEILKRTAGGWACGSDSVGTGDGVGATTVGALDGGTANANGATITGTSLFLQSASATNPGLINTGTQTFAGTKTFNGAVTLAGGATVTGNITASGTINGATISGGTLSAGSFTGGSVSGGTITGGTLSATTVNGLDVSGTAVTGSGALTVASATNTNLTLNASGTGNLYLTGYDCSASGGGGKLTVDATGQVICGADGDTDTTGITTITAGNGITITGGNNTIAASFRTGYGVQIDGNGIGLIDTCATNDVLKRTAGGWACGTDTVGTGDGVGATTIGALDGGTANANGATITGTSLFLQSASDTNPGLINTGIQTFGGAKTFNGAVTLAGGATVTGNITASGTINGATISGGTLSAGSFTGGSVSGGTITGGTLSATTVNGLDVSGTAVTGSGALTVASATNTNLTLNASGTGNLYLTGYDCSASGGGGKLTVDATGQVICGADGDTDTTGVTISGTATDGTLTKFNSSGQIMNSNLSETGTTLTYDGNAIVNAATGFTGNLLDLQLNGTSRLSVTEAGNTTIAGNLTLTSAAAYLKLGDTSSGATATPTTLDMGSSLANSVTSAKAKWLLYNNGTSIQNYGIGISAQQFNFFKAANGSYKWYFADVEKMGLDSSGNLTTTGTINGATLSGTALTGSGALSVASANNTNLTLNAAGTGNVYLTGYDCSGSGGGGKLTVDGTGLVTCDADGGGGVTVSGSATDGRLTKFNSSGQILNSSLSETSTTLTYSGNVVVNAATGFTGNLLDAQLNGVSRLSVTDTGDLTVSGTVNGATLTGGSLSASAVNGLNVSGTAIAGSGALAISSATNTNLTLQGTGTGIISLNDNVSLTGTLTYGSASAGLLSADSSGVVSKLTGTLGDCLLAQGAGVAPIFTTCPSGGSAGWTTSGNNVYQSNTGNRVLIGTTTQLSSSTAKLQVRGTTTSGILVQDASTTAGATGLQVVDNSDKNILNVDYATAGNLITIGDSTPTAKATNVSLYGELTFTQASVGIQFADGSSLTSANSGVAGWTTSGNNVYQSNASNRVLIGTTSQLGGSTAKLQIRANASSGIYVEDSSVTAGYAAMQLVDANGYNMMSVDYQSATLGTPNVLTLGDAAATKATNVSLYGGLTFTQATAGITLGSSGSITVNSLAGITTTCAAGQALNNIRVTGGVVTQGTCATNGADLAESYKSVDTLVAGEIVSVDGANYPGVKRSASGYDSKLMGVVSTKPHETLGDADSSDDYPIALVGRVPTKVNLEGGVIHAGDKITSSSVPGVGMKATGSGMTVGTALQDYDGTGEAVIQVFVEVSYHEASQAELLQANAAEFADLNVSGTATIDTLVVNTVVVQGSLTVNGTISTQGILVNGHIISGGSSPTVTAEAACSTLSAAVDGTDTAGTITVTTNSDCTANDTFITVAFASPFSKAPRVTLTAANAKAAAVQTYVDSDAVSGSNFAIGASTTLSAGNTYKWYYQVIE